MRPHQRDGAWRIVAKGNTGLAGELNKALAAIPSDKIPTVLDETALAVGGLGPTLQRLLDNTQAWLLQANGEWLRADAGDEPAHIAQQVLLDKLT